MKMAIMGSVVVLAMFSTGCAQLREGIGNGRVFGVVDVDDAAKAVDKLYPGSGSALRAISSGAADLTGKTPIGPFGGLPYTIRRDVVLTDGTRIPEERIAQIVETLTPVVPAAIVRVVAPASFATAPPSDKPDAPLPAPVLTEPAVTSPAASTPAAEKPAPSITPDAELDLLTE